MCWALQVIQGSGLWRTSAWLDSELAPITQAETVHDGRIVIFFPSFGTVAAIARLRPAHPAVQELLTQAQRIEASRGTPSTSGRSDPSQPV